MVIINRRNIGTGLDLFEIKVLLIILRNEIIEMTNIIFKKQVLAIRRSNSLSGNFYIDGIKDLF